MKSLQGFRGAFFDRPAVAQYVDKKTRAALSKIGAFTRRAAKSSIRKRKRASRPGEPPSSHVGTLRRHIYFGLARRSVVVGALEFQRSGIPKTLEHGGAETFRRKFKIGRRGPLRAGQDPRRWTRLKTTAQVRRAERLARRARYEARPFIRPAAAKVLHDLKKVF